MLNFFRPLNMPRMANDEPKPQSATDMQIGEVYQNTAGFFHDAKRTWQIFVPIPLRNFTSVLYDLLTLKTRPQELLMSDTEHFRECLRINVGDFTFQEAFDRTGRILNITGKRSSQIRYYVYKNNDVTSSQSHKRCQRMTLGLTLTFSSSFFFSFFNYLKLLQTILVTRLDY